MQSTNKTEIETKDDILSKFIKKAKKKLSGGE